MEALSCINKDCFDLLNRHQLLRPLVRAEVISSELESVDISTDEKNEIMQRLWEQNGITSEEQFVEWLNKNDLSRDSLEKQITDPVRLTRYCQVKFGLRAEVRFLERKHEIDQVVYSLIRVKDPFKARELYLQIEEGEADFGEIATQYSEGKEGSTRGIVGPVPLVQAHPKLVEILRSSQPGELREPIQVEDWYLLVRLESYQPAVLDAAMEQRMAQELFSEWVEGEVGRRIDELSTANSEVLPQGESRFSS
jgi:parvulin-like peptidyl-prolyl isomerase